MDKILVCVGNALGEGLVSVETPQDRRQQVGRFQELTEMFDEVPLSSQRLGMLALEDSYDSLQDFVREIVGE